MKNMKRFLSLALVLCMAVALFAVATVVCWAHYALECSAFLFGERRLIRNTIAVIYSSAILSVAVYRGDLHWQIADIAMGGMTVINIIALVLGRREIKKETVSVFGIDRRRKR